MKPTLRRPSQGFTLIELLVAITLMAIVSILSWRGLDTIAHVRNALEQRAEQTDALLSLLGQLERDLTLRAPDMVLAPALVPTLPAAPNTGSPNSGSVDTGTSGTGGTAQTARVAIKPQTLPLAVEVTRPGRDSNNQLTLIRSGPYEAGTWQRVEWWLENGQLLRSVGAPSATYPLPAPTPENTAVVLTGVSQFEIFGWVRDLGWQELPRPADATTPIDGLQIVIVREDGEQSETYRRIISFQ